MTNEMIFVNEMLSDVELDNVAGGKVGELADLTEAMFDKWPVLAKFGKGAAHVPGVNNLLATMVVGILKKEMGIEADIGLGLGGSGLGSSSNYYKEISSGNRLSHSEVLKRINQIVQHL